MCMNGWIFSVALEPGFKGSFLKNIVNKSLNKYNYCLVPGTCVLIRNIIVLENLNYNWRYYM